MSMRAVRRVVAVLLVGVTAALACKGEDPFVPVVTTIVVSPSTRTFTSLTLTQQFTATVQDQRGDGMAGQAVVWGTTNGTVASVSPAGIVTAAGAGTATIRATIGTVVGQANVTVTQVPRSLFKFDGDQQIASVGAALGVPLIVRVLDSMAAAVPGVTVTFAATTGGGSVGSPTTVSDAQGLVSSTWTMGLTTGTQTATASATSVPSLVFNATALAASPDTIIKTSTDGQTVPAGTPILPAPAVLVRDRFGNPVSGVLVTFLVTAGGGQVTGANQITSGSGIATVGSWIVGVSGAQELTATADDLGLGGIGGNPITFSASALPPGAPTAIAVSAGNNQTGLQGYAVNVPPAAIVRDASSNPVQGVTVDFQVTGGGGSVTPASAVTDLLGIARVGSWTINGGANTLTASVIGIASPATFSATGVASAMNLDVRYLTGVTASQQAAFDSAAARWARVLFGELSDVPVNTPVGGPPGTGCQRPQVPAVNETIDDLVIFVILEFIDGPGQILGSAGPCLIRGGSAGTPLMGLMRFDTADLVGMESNNILVPVILHEMGHVLGLGTLWQTRGLLSGPGSVDPFFTGAQARAAFDQIGGASYTGGGKVPVENTGGAGTRDGHWRETVFTNELMTGFISLGTNPMSVVTAAQYGDLGYPLLNQGATDAFTVTVAALRAAATGAGIHLRDDILRAPIQVLDERGRVTRVIQPQ
jgi:hypothetical protein